MRTYCSSFVTLCVKLALFIKTYFPKGDLKQQLFSDSLHSSCFSPRGLITCGQCPCCLSRTSPITSVSPYLWVCRMLSLCCWVHLLSVTDFSSPRAFHSQSEVSCATAGETSSYSDYHFLIQSSCVWDGRRCVPVPFTIHHVFPLWLPFLLFCDGCRVSPHYCTLFLKDIHTKQKLHSTVPTSPHVYALRHLFLLWSLEFETLFLSVT